MTISRVLKTGVHFMTCAAVLLQLAGISSAAGSPVLRRVLRGAPAVNMAV